MADNVILINITFNETRVAVVENGSVAELYIERTATPRIVGNIYKGVVSKVIPGMQAAFIDIGHEKSGFISVEDVQEDSIYELFFGEGEESKPHRDDRSLIQDMLREGQHVIVQVLKESVGGKGAKLSSYVAIPGKYLVLLGTIDMVGISRKIEEPEERERLSSLLRSLKPAGVGLIARTACMGVPEDRLEQDLKELIRTWEEIKNRCDKQKVRTLLYEEPKLYLKAVRDFVSTDITKVIVDSAEVHKILKNYLKENFPDSKVNIELYKKNSPIFLEYGIESEIKKIFKKQVWLKSGGHIIIEEAEGLTVVDVNTGRYQSGKDQEETIYNLNIEAASEIVRQIRLRNLVGIIVIDFIDIRNRQLREKVYKEFVEALKKDRSKSVVLEISSFGVIQLTRQRLRESVLSELAEPCYMCEGVGYLKSQYTVAYEIIREIKLLLKKTSDRKVTVRANSNVIDTLLETESGNINRLQKENGVKIEFERTGARIENFQISSE